MTLERPSPTPGLPSATQLMWPTLEVLRDLGGSGTNQEILEAVVTQLGLSEQQQSVLRTDGLTTELYSRLSLARTYLKAAGAVEHSRRGVWAITEAGREMTEASTQGLAGRYLAALRERHGGAPRANAGGAIVQEHATTTAQAIEAAEEEAAEATWKDDLLRIIRDMSPQAFERLALRLLREAGFSNTEVTGRPGDEGIDGSGVYHLSLISFPVYFQCKRYAGSVGPGEIRDFRGAMEGRGEKGLMITTGTFTGGAKQEAMREGARPIDLIDGDRLCDLLKEYGVGVRVEQVERVQAIASFFTEI
ncbi:MAG: restriction endonuclease [bacterium]